MPHVTIQQFLKSFKFHNDALQESFEDFCNRLIQSTYQLGKKKHKKMRHQIFFFGQKQQL